MKRAVVTVGLGFGDEGKGATVDYLCRTLPADLVIRYSGGSQAGHNVQLPDGRRHTFAQFGAGTLAGVPTYLGEAMILQPAALLREAEHLQTLNIPDPFALLTVHPGCLVSTFLHQAVNQLKELSRGEGRHGSCGHGIGETRHYWLRYGADAIFAADLRDRVVLRRKLELLRQRLFLDLQAVIASVPRDALREYDLLDLTADALAEPLLEAGERLHLRAEIPACDTAVFEGAQGVLLDEWLGFHPHTTWSTVTPHHALEMVQQVGAEQLCVLGLTRAYATRHGAGPLPTFDAALTAHVGDQGNPWNPWQGTIRAGWLDLMLLRYAVAACGPIDGLAVSCLDHLQGITPRAGMVYEGCKRLPLPVGPNLQQQEQLGQMLQSARPVYREVREEALLGLLEEMAPVVLQARGPTHRDRQGLALPFRKRVRAG